MADGPGGGAKSFGRSTFRSSFIGATALLPKAAGAGEDEDLALKSDDDEDDGEDNKENGTGAHQAPPSFFMPAAAGETQPTQIDSLMSLTAEDGSETEVQHEPSKASLPDAQAMDQDLPDVDKLDGEVAGGGKEAADEDEDDEATQPDVPVVYATSGRMKVLGANAMISALQAQASATSKKAAPRRGSKAQPRAQPQQRSMTRPRLPLSALGPAPSPHAQVAQTPVAADPEPAASAEQIEEAVRALVESLGETAATEGWSGRRWTERVCEELGIDFDPSLRQMVNTAVMSNSEFNQIVAAQSKAEADEAFSQTQTQNQSQTQPQTQQTQEQLMSQIDEVFGGGDDDNGDENGADEDDAEMAPSSAARWGGDEDDEDEDEVAALLEQEKFKQRSGTNDRYWGDEESEDEAPKKRPQVAGKDKAKSDKARRREERERKLREKAERKAARKAEKKAAKLAAKKAAKAAKSGLKGEGDGEGGAAAGSDAEASAGGAGSDKDDDDAEVSDAPSSPESSDNEGDVDSDEYDDAGDSSKKKNKKGSSKPKDQASTSKGRGGKKDGAAPEVSAVESEIAAIKALDQGPSEAEVRTRRLVEIDEEERLERVYRMNLKALSVLSKAQSRTVADECRQLREIKLWIKGQCGKGVEQIVDDIEDAMDRHTFELHKKHDGKYRPMGSNRYGSVDPEFFLKRDQQKDDEEEADDLAELSPEPSDDEGEDIGATKSKPAAADAAAAMDVAAGEGAEAEDMVYMSDSEDENEAEGDAAGQIESAPVAEADAAPTQEQTAPFVKPVREPVAMQSKPITDPKGLFPLLVTTNEEKLTPQPLALAQAQAQHKLESLRLYQHQREMEKQRVARARHAMLAVRSANPGSRRELEKQRLVRKVAAKAEDEYCQRLHITAAYLPLKREIFENCRRLVDLLRERADRQRDKQRARDVREVERRRRVGLRRMQQWAAERDAEEAEFDFDDSANQRPARELSEEELQKLLQEMQQEDEEEDEEDEVDEEEEDDPDEEEAVVRLHLQRQQEAEEREQKRLAAGAKGGDGDGGGERGALADGDAASNMEEEEDEDEEGGEEEEDEDEGGEENVTVQPRNRRPNRAIEDDEDEGAPSAPAGASAAVGAKASQEAADDDAMWGDNDESQTQTQTQAQTQAQEAPRERRKKKSGNSLFRQMVEEEERRARADGKSRLVDAEADEDEEEGMQKGLNDFGFGTGARDNDDERDALQVRADDFANIVDELSDDERDEADEEQAERMRREQEMRDEIEANKRIAQGIVEGKSRQRKGQMSFDKLVGGPDVGGKLGAEGEEGAEDLDPEELLQRYLAEGLAGREQARRLAAADSDSEGDADDVDEDGLAYEDDGTMTEEQRAAQDALLARKREERRQERLRLRNLENAARIERARRKLKAQHSQSQSQSQFHSQAQGFAPSAHPRLSRQPTLTLSSLGLDEDDLVPPPVSLKRSFSQGLGGGLALAPGPTPTAAAAASAAAAAAAAVAVAAPAAAAEPVLAAAAADAAASTDSETQVMSERGNDSQIQQQQSESQGLGSERFDSQSQEWAGAQGDSQQPAEAAADESQQVVFNEGSQSQLPSSTLRNITNIASNNAPAAPGAVVKRRTALPPRRIEPKPVVRPGAPGAASGAAQQPAIKRSKTAYSGALDESEVAAGFGMGMAVPGARRMPAADGLFSAVVGLKRTDSGAGLALGSSVAGLHRSNSTTAHPAKKYRGVGSSSSNIGGAVTVAGQQFVFGSSTLGMHDDGGSQMAGSNFAGGPERSVGFGGPSSSGWDSSRAGAAMSRAMGAPAGALVAAKAAAQGSSLARTTSSNAEDKSSLFAKLHKR